MGPNDKEVNDRVPDQSLWSNNPLRQQNTSNNCAEQRRGRTLRINTGATEAVTTHQQLPERSSQHEEDQHPRPHRFLKWKEHGNWVVKEGEAHLKHLFIQQLVAHDLVRITMISTTNNLANVFTKYVETETLLRHIGDVGINTHHY